MNRILRSFVCLCCMSILPCHAKFDVYALYVKAPKKDVIELPTAVKVANAVFATACAVTVGSIAWYLIKTQDTRLARVCDEWEHEYALFLMDKYDLKKALHIEDDDVSIQSIVKAYDFMLDGVLWQGGLKRAAHKFEKLAKNLSAHIHARQAEWNADPIAYEPIKQRLMALQQGTFDEKTIEQISARLNKVYTELKKERVVHVCDLIRELVCEHNDDWTIDMGLVKRNKVEKQFPLHDYVNWIRQEKLVLLQLSVRANIDEKQGLRDLRQTYDTIDLMLQADQRYQIETDRMYQDEKIKLSVAQVAQGDTHIKLEQQKLKLEQQRLELEKKHKNKK
ncbi:MAG: hypothetical protein UU47_C0007G0027 [candidate division TM6 bacterium GW2011_GWE2_41_16]|nr:MAG: hypothetical protein UU47_C0007G0027 [candidate division TM6 bacterium GW2011_GWE2_41_16]